MKKLWVIASKDVGEAFQSRTIYVFMLVMLFIAFSYVSVYDTRVKLFSNQQDILNFSRDFLNNLAYIMPLMYSIIICSIFANYSVVLDKAKRNIESLMATPVSIQQIWMGKSLAVTLPSVIVGLAISIIVYLVMNFGFVIPKTDTFIVPGIVAILSALVVVPVLTFSIVTVVINIQLIINNPRLANLVFTGIFLLLVFGINTLGGLGVSISYFPLVYLGVILICAGVSLILSRALTKEKVLLSSKV
jgi:ABC-type transport system involved in multi-copper enzyme maturation permease subunit